MEAILFDGHDLAVKCANAPGLADLRDRKGRKTGEILATLRLVGSYRARFPRAFLLVVWDGSSEKRRALFPGYKGSRAKLRETFSVEFMKRALPLLGVEQAWHPEEEADDVLGALARQMSAAGAARPLYVVSTDRDLHQLSAEDVFLVTPPPRAGKGKEVVLDSLAVLHHWGVRPSRLPELRALIGDTSDEIPGVEGIGPRRALDLLNTYGTLDALFASDMKKATKLQRERLRAAEGQVRLNRQLMTLRPLDPRTFTRAEAAPDAARASRLLSEVDIRPESIVPLYFPRQSSFA